MKLVTRWLSATLLLAACQADVRSVPATQVVARLDAAPAVLAKLASLRVRTAAEEDGKWINRNDATFALKDLRWPVDFVLSPRSEAAASDYFEIIVDALDASGRVLVQARALSAYVLREKRVLTLELEACGGQPLGFVCEAEAECYGPDCRTCISAVCNKTPLTAPSELDALDPSETVDGGSARRDAGVGDARARTDAAPPADTDAAGPAGDGGPTSCATGLKSDGRGGCADVDECAEELDDCNEEPDACINQMGDFTCKCPTGFAGEGRGPDGCSDVDECATGTAQCDALAPCKNVAGSYTCGDCPPGYSGGAGGSCVDIDECTSNNGGCSTSPMAACKNQTGATNTCSCPPFFMGSGSGAGSCVDVNECDTNNGGCSPQATCGNKVGAANTCACKSGYTGNGMGASGCIDANDCAGSPCKNGGVCTDGLNVFSCACTAGFTGPTCELQICGDTTIRSKADLDAARSCGALKGNLFIGSAGLSAISASDLPNLTAVSGRLAFSSFFASGGVPLTDVTMAALQSAGTLETAGSGEDSLLRMHFPALTTVGTPGQTSNAFQITEVGTKIVDVPKLATVHGLMQSGLANNLCSLNMKALTKLEGKLSLINLPNLPASAWATARASVTDTAEVSGLGCCVVLDNFACDNFDVTLLPSGSCGVAGGCL